MQYERPYLYPKQFQAFFHTKRYGLIEASTKAGKTVGGMAWLLEQALIGPGKAGRNYWWVAPVFPQAEIAYARMRRGLSDNVAEPQGKLKLVLCNGASIWFKSGEKPDNLYGEDVFACVIDEASRVREDSFNAIRSTLTATNGHIRAIGNVKGRQNWFYRMSRKAEAGEPNMEFHRIIAADAVAAGILTAEEIEDAKRVLPEQVFKELYLAEPSDDGGNPFGHKAIGECVKPLSSLPPKVWGIDLAKSVDWTVAIALDGNGDVCRFERWQSPWGETKDRIKRIVGTTKAYLDSTGVGDPIVEELHRMSSNFEGFKFSSSSKQQIMEGLATAIQSHTIGYPDGLIRLELESFEYEITRTNIRYSAPEGMHDDCVCALALAVYHHKIRRPGIFDIL